MADVVQNAVNEANRKIVEDNSLKLALEPQIAVPREQGRGREGAWTPRATWPSRSRSRCCRASSSADLSDVSVKKPVVEVAETRGRPSRSSAWPSRTAPSSPRRGARPPTATASWSISSAASTATEFEGGNGAGHPRRARLGHLHPRLRGAARRRQGRRQPNGRRSPSRRTTWRAHLAGKAAEFDVTVKEVAGAGRAGDRRRARQGLRHGIARQAEGRRPRRRSQRDFDAQSRRKLKQELLDALDAQVQLRAAAEPRRAGVRGRLGAGRGRHEDRQQDLRGRGHDRGGGARRVPQDRRAPRAPRPGACADRREGRYQGHRRRGHAGPRRAGPPVSPARRSRSGSSTGRTRRRWPRSARRSSRKRSSTTSSPR